MADMDDYFADVKLEPDDRRQEPQTPQTLPSRPAAPYSLPSSSRGDFVPKGAAGAQDNDAADVKAVKRARTSKPKVKTGCNNCKQRRIKCDEKRPACTQCVRSKKDCSGYPPPARSARPFEEIRIAPKPGPTLLAAAPIPNSASPSTISLVPSLPQRAPLIPLGIRPQQQQQLQADQRQDDQRHRAQIPQRRAQKLQQRRMHESQLSLTASSTTAPANAVAIAAAAPLLYHPHAGLPFRQQEGLYFQLFRSQTASELSGFFDDIFWSRTVLVECHSEAAIRHAVVALGALYKTLEKTTESPPSSPSDTTYDSKDTALGHWEVALRQYSSAIYELATLDAEDERTQRTRLMASVLLACFDSFVGDHKQAIVQIQAGLALLDRLRVERRRSQATLVPAEPVEDELTQMFTRLAIQAKSYDMAFHFPQPYVIQLLPAGAPGLSSTPESSTDMGSPSSPPAGTSDVSSPVSTHQDPIPDQFQSLREARLAWDTLCEHIFRFMEFMFQYASGPPNILPKSMTSFGYEFRARIEAWSDAFEPLLSGRANPGVSSQEKAGIAVLKMFQIMGQILYLMTFSDSEMKFDAFQLQFKAIVDLAAEVVGDEERRAAAARCPDPDRCGHHSHSSGVDMHGKASHLGDQHHQHQNHHGFGSSAKHIKASFSADLGIVPPLYVVATKSRDRILRRRAIDLLRSSARREGMWDSELVARIGMWVMGIEEEGEEAEFYELVRRRNSSIVSTGSIGSIGSIASIGSLGGMANHSYPSPPKSGSGLGPAPIDFGAMPLGPGGNARWDTRRASQVSALLHTTAAGRGHSPSFSAAPLDESLPYYMQLQRPIPAEKRVLVKACEFDLREHTATLQCGTRGLVTGAPDIKTRVTQIKW